MRHPQHSKCGIEKIAIIALAQFTTHLLCSIFEIKDEHLTNIIEMCFEYIYNECYRKRFFLLKAARKIMTGLNDLVKKFIRAIKNMGTKLRRKISLYLEHR